MPDPSMLKLIHYKDFRLNKSLAMDKRTVLCSLTGHKKRDDTEQQQRVCVPYASNCEIFSHTSTPINGFIRQSKQGNRSRKLQKKGEMFCFTVLSSFWPLLLTCCTKEGKKKAYGFRITHLIRIISVADFAF